ncbi:MAG: pyridoxamine 5'-phosphate oxidase family protein [Bacteroidales bacterium]|nr:pyridoxamine 5'-phosphate oxidase family protein [Bacteroidales bacterium]
MSKLVVVKKYIEDIFKTSRFAVLATEGDGQPHASYVAITPMDSYRALIFATYRNTQKYLNLIRNGKVALLVESGKHSSTAQQDSFVLTAFGHMEEIGTAEKEHVFNKHLKWHPDLLSFMQAEDCTLVRIKVDTYQVVRGIDDVEWWSINDIDEDKSN